MISVKGTRQTADPADPAAPYAQKPEEKQGVVARLAVFLAAITVALKVFLTGKAEAQETAPEEQPQDEPRAPRVSVIPGGLEDDAPEGGLPGSQRQADLPEPAPFEFTPQEDTIAFGTPHRIGSPMLQPVAYLARLANDNAPPALNGPAMPALVPVAPTLLAPATAGKAVPDMKRDPIPSDPNPNRAPRVTGPVHLRDVSASTVMVIGLSDFLRGAGDPDGDKLMVEGVAASAGKIEDMGHGIWMFTAGEDPGPVRISYRISDGEASVAQTLNFVVLPSRVIAGTDGNDTLIGKADADQIEAGGGQDLVEGRSGNDTILGEGGDDRLWGDAGDDLVFGGDGNDDLRGGPGSDRLFGQAGDDRLFGESGDDLLMGGIGNDHLSGGEGHDRLMGDAGDDMLFGDDGDDTIEGGEGNDFVMAGLGNDQLMGGAGSDVLDGDEGQDRIAGGPGNDTIRDGLGTDVALGDDGDDRIVAAQDGARDVYEGGRGDDLLDYSAAESALLIDIAAGRVSGAEIGGDQFSGFERVLAGSGDDIIRFGGSAVTMGGGDGWNIFQFEAPERDVANSATNSATRYEIEDFKVGDRLKLSTWEIFEEVFEAVEDRFDKVYGNDADSNRVPIRYQNEWAETDNETLIEADLDKDNVFETAIVLNGRHALVLVET
ncbi:cadherin-like domain-containing protein [Paracoccus sp. WLY502]|uniref:cadherin-like domain-containing protein n=1 Tax=Paracoccus yibinensis TaxID=3068891 RepID=UPI002796B753|nr:cadherin-like domain-containing protein [Paracoccus sp. WLY502]MDQ1900393.1 cadherin-like domain-containing protein [Paracoccus sp. WLY502]